MPRCGIAALGREAVTLARRAGEARLACHPSRVSEVPANVNAAISSAVQPPPAEYLRVREVVLAALTEGAVSEEDLRRRVHEASAVPVDGRTPELRLSRPDAVEDISPDHLALKVRRIQR